MYVTLATPHFEKAVPVGPAHGISLDGRPSRQKTWKAGQFLFHEGDEAKNVYEVVSGVLRLTRVTESGRRQVTAFGYPGDIIGFPNGEFHHTECDVLSTAEVIAHPRSILELGTSDVKLHNRLTRAMLNEISGMQDHFIMLGRKSASEKVASFLNVLAERVGSELGAYTQVDLPMNRSDIADFLGLTTETVSRTFTSFRNSKIIALSTAHKVIILKPEALASMAEGE